MESRQLPPIRKGSTKKVAINELDLYITVNFFEDDKPGEVLVVIGKQESTLAGITDALAMTISIALQHGVPLDVLLKKYRGYESPSIVQAIAQAIEEMSQERESLYADVKD
jgi:hypothetical protein